MNGRLIGLFRQLIRTYERQRLRHTPFVLLSNNCWGYELYQALERPYNTPFVGLYLHPSCYLHLLQHLFPHDLRLKTVNHLSRYHAKPVAHPVGHLRDGVELHLLHYTSLAEAEAKWHRRVDRLMTALDAADPHLRLKFCTCDGATPAQLQTFHQLGLGPTVSFGLHPLSGVPERHCADRRLVAPDGQNLVDGVSLYWTRYRHFDLTTWIRTGQVRPSPFSRALGRTP